MIRKINYIYRVDDGNQYIEVHFDQQVQITGVQSQGHAELPSWVTKYRVSYSSTGLEPFVFYKESTNANPKVK